MIIAFNNIFLFIFNVSVEKEQNSCCCDAVEKLRKIIQNKDQQLLTHILINNTNQIKVCTFLENMDKKINKFLERDRRTQTFAFPLPKIPAPFIELLPIISINSLEVVEQLLSVDNDNFNRNVEELVS